MAPKDIAMTAVPVRDSLIGRVINNYEIKSFLAEGGMGKVYLAQHPVIGRRAAIKVLRGAYLEDKNMVTRFVNEARAANAIHHPNIVEIIDVGFLQGEQPYLMMEFLEGETLSHRLARAGRLPPEETVRILDQVASALEAAHAAGIVHRDLKPENLFLVPDAAQPGGERVKVVDFGIAKLQDAPNTGVRTTGIVLGTPIYMSPEQCRGTGIDHRADIYALGVIAYQMLCGRPPFVSETQIELMMMHVGKLPTPPRELFSDISSGLEEITLRALAKRPDDRFTSMRELRLALGSTGERTDGEPSPGNRSRSAIRPARAFLQRGGRRWIWISMVMAAATAAGWAGISRRHRDGWPAVSTPAPASLQEQPTRAVPPPLTQTSASTAPVPAPPAAAEPTKHPAGAASSAPARRLSRSRDKLAGGIHGVVPF